MKRLHVLTSDSCDSSLQRPERLDKKDSSQCVKTKQHRGFRRRKSLSDCLPSKRVARTLNDRRRCPMSIARLENLNEMPPPRQSRYQNS